MTKKMINRGKGTEWSKASQEEKALSEVKPAKNISNNLQSFLEISPVQREILFSHKLQDHAYE